MDLSYFATLSPTKVIMSIALVALVVLVMRTLSKRNALTTSQIDLDGLLLDADGRMSKSAMVMFGSFGLTSWMMIYLTMTGKMSEGYLTIYGGLWIIPTVTKLIKGTVSAASPPSQP